MIRSRVSLLISLFGLFLGVVFCGGSDTKEVSSFGDVPSMDASDYDFSLSNAVETLTRAGTRMQAAESTFSRAACEGYTLKRQLFRDAKQLEGFLCYIRTLEAANLGMTIPSEGFRYYEITFPPRTEDYGPPENVRVRIGKSGDELKMDACMPNGSTYERELEFRFDPTDTGYQGHAVNVYRFTQDEGEEFTGSSRIDVTLVGASIDSFDSAEFSAYHRDRSVTDDTKGWTSVMTFAANGTEQTNSLSGANSYSSTDGQNNENAMVGRWGTELVGSVKYSATGSYPPPTEAQCLAWGMPPENLSFCVGKCYNQQGEIPPNDEGRCPFENTGAESFSIDNSTTPPTFTKTADDASGFFTAVSEATLPTLDDITSHLAFTEEWTCEGEGDFVLVDASALTTIVADCEVSQEEELWRMCEEQQRAAEGQ